MSKFELKLPKMGESVAEATLTAWLKDIGDSIEFDEPVLEIATDKVDSEVPSEKKGVLIEKCFEINDVIKVGQTIAIIETDEIEILEETNIEIIFEVLKVIMQQNSMANLIYLENLRKKNFQKILMHLN